MDSLFGKLESRFPGFFKRLSQVRFSSAASSTIGRATEVSRRFKVSEDPFLRLVIFGAVGSLVFLFVVFGVLLISFRFQDASSGYDTSSDVSRRDFAAKRSEADFVEEQQRRLDGVRDDFVAQYKQLLEDNSELRDEIKMQNEGASALAMQQYNNEIAARQEEVAKELKLQREQELKNQRIENCSLAVEKLKLSRLSSSPAKLAADQQAAEQLCSGSGQ